MDNRRWGGTWLALGGLIVCQAILFGPSLIGQKLPLPLEILAQPLVYLPQNAQTRAIEQHNRVYSDPVFSIEHSRRFAAREFRAGRAPLWNPFGFCGAPTAVFPAYSPFLLPYYLTASPYSLAWIQMLVAVVAGLGAFAFFRVTLGVGLAPALIGAWCYPITGFFVLWQGIFLTHPLACLPWVLLATDASVRRRHPWAPLGLTLATGCLLLGGYGAAHAFLAAGLYAAWATLDVQGWRPSRSETLRAAAPCLLGFALGVMLAAPHWVPLADYIGTTERMSQRRTGAEERPPIGAHAALEVVLPDIHGSSHRDSYRIVPGNRLESATGAYAGLLAALVFAPLAWRSRRHRSISVLLGVVGVLSLGWQLNLPGWVDLMRLPGVNSLSHNRAVFLAAFALVSMAVIGLDVVGRNRVGRRWWFLIPALLLLMLGVYSAHRSVHLPEPIATRLAESLQNQRRAPGVPTMQAVNAIQASYRQTYRQAALLCAVGMGAWLLVAWGVRAPRSSVVAAGALLVGELLWFAYDHQPQNPPELYFPRISVLSRLAAAPPGRIVCLRCLPPRLNESHELSDIRGYDAADPTRLLDLLEIAKGSGSRGFTYAQTQWYMPKVFVEGPEIRVSPVLDMLNLRYLIFREPLLSKLASFAPLMREGDYGAFENPNALPRAFVPRSVVAMADGAPTLERLAAPDFDAREVAYVNAELGLPTGASGAARITAETPREVEIRVDMQGRGLLVLADLWYAGWRAYVDGKEVPVLRVNHAIRGVVLEGGPSEVRFYYDPRGHAWGIGIFAAGMLSLLLWTLVRAWHSRQGTGCGLAEM